MVHKLVTVVALAAALLMATAAMAAKPLRLKVPPGLNPDNVEFIIPGLPNHPFPKVNSRPWGIGGKCGVNCLGFESDTPLTPGDFLHIDNLEVTDPATPGALKIEKIIWTCGKNNDTGAYTPCPNTPPATIYEENPPTPEDPMPPDTPYTPSVAAPVYAKFLVPEPGTWAMLVGGFGLVGGMARRQRALRGASAG